MYKFSFISDDDRAFAFDFDQGIFADVDFGSSVPVNITVSQGFAQIGATPERESVGPRPIKVKGQLSGNIPAKKEAMRRALLPFCRGWLVFGDYEIRVLVQDPPSFKTEKTNGAFMLRFFAPHPWFRRREETVQMIGSITPEFRFPVNYGQKHRFGTRSPERSAILDNGGDVKVPFTVRIEAGGASVNPVISNLSTAETLRLNGSLQNGDIVNLYRENGIARAELERAGEIMDILSWVDEASDFYFLRPGLNKISASDDTQAQNIFVTLSFREEVVAVYES